MKLILSCQSLSIIIVIDPSTQEYFERLANSVPIEYLVIGIAVSCFSCLCFFALNNLRTAVRLSSILVLTEYLFLLLCSMVLLRKDIRLVGYNFKPFRSYVGYFCFNEEYLLPQVLLNILVFIPIGLLLCLSFRNWKWWQMLSIGGGFSITVELLQLLYKKGFCEIDDVIHNMLGCLIGIVMFRVIIRCHQKVFFRSTLQ